MITPYWFTNLTYWSGPSCSAHAWPLDFFRTFQNPPAARAPHLLASAHRRMFFFFHLCSLISPELSQTATLMPADEFARDFPAFKFDQIPSRSPGFVLVHSQI